MLLPLMHTLFAQKAFSRKELAAIDKKALQLPDSLTRNTTDMASYINTHFRGDRDRARAIFIWIASNIQYDIENVFAINFYEKMEAKIDKPLKTRKGICENYAALFNDLCAKCGIKSYLIEGYTRQNGFTEYIPHAWCVARIDTAWYMFDPTWGAGSITERKFVRRINNTYFQATPSILIKTHMPFDYLWQFLRFPITNQEFYEGKTEVNLSKAYFNYTDSLKLYESQSRQEQLKGIVYRIQKNGLKNSMLFDRLRNTQVELDNIKIGQDNARRQKIINTYNSAVQDYNDGINAYNEFIHYKNARFTPLKPDADIQEMMNAAENKLKNAIAKLASVNESEIDGVTPGQLGKAVEDVARKVAEEQEWLKTYFSKKRADRKDMFYGRR